MKPTEKYYVTFYSPGTFFAESSTKRIVRWSTIQAVKMAEGITERYGAKPYGFRFETRLEQETVAGIASKTIAQSGVYFMNAKVKTYEEIAKVNHEDDYVLLNNMRNNGYPLIATNDGKSKNYHFSIPFDMKKDALVDGTGKVILDGRDPVYSMYAEFQNLAFKTYWQDFGFAP